jgi:hypothetical protein
MKTILVLALLLSGCAGVEYDSANDQGRVHRAAMSWVGAPIDAMVQAWGEPNNLKIEATENNDGLMRWRETRRPSGMYTSAGGKSYTCIVEAYFGIDGTINRVETMTNNCDKRYTDEQLDQLER